MDRKKIVFVDDDISMLYAYQRMLRSLNYQCEFETEPLKILRRSDLADVSVLLVDYRMPVFSGPQLLAALRHNYPAMKRVLLSDDIVAAKHSLGSAVQIDAVLAKPCSKMALVGCLERLLTD